jgi:hypothetical protein
MFSFGSPAPKISRPKTPAAARPHSRARRTLFAATGPAALTRV